MKYEFFISLTYLKTKRKEKFISIISLISIIGIAVGVMTLIVVIGVMSGFDAQLRDKIIGTNSHLIIEKENGIDNYQEVNNIALKNPHVLAVSEFVSAQVMIRSKDYLANVVLRGINPETEPAVTNIKEYLKYGVFNLQDKGIIIGKQLAARLGKRIGGRIEVLSPINAEITAYNITGIFDSGMYDFDSALVFTSIDQAKKITMQEDVVSGIGIKIDDVYKADKVKDELKKILTYPYWVRSWMDINRNLFNALRLEKTAMFIILALIVVVAALNIVSTLMMTVMEKTKDIGILKSVGATNNSIRKIFILDGLMIGTLGTFFGGVCGFLLSYILKNYDLIKLPQDIYYIDKLPIKIETFDISLIIIAALAISLMATLYPAHQAAQLKPVEALRYE
ncbi:MAG: lipoprotein-releasing ABC transporter permease subunit [Candidatus Omnitrophota bacterium]